jgi:hypothetical protein
METEVMPQGFIKMRFSAPPLFPKVKTEGDAEQRIPYLPHQNFLFSPAWKRKKFIDMLY